MGKTATVLRPGIQPGKAAWKSRRLPVFLCRKILGCLNMPGIQPALFFAWLLVLACRSGVQALAPAPAQGKEEENECEYIFHVLIL